LTFLAGYDRYSTGICSVHGAFVNTAIIILFHGSKAEGSDATVQRIIAEVRRRGHFSIVAEAFLQHATPGLRESLAFCVQQHAKKIVIVPFFLQLGMHVTADIPLVVNELRSAHPEIEIALTEPVGSHPLLVDVVLDLAGREN
jgi:sirohydrochlorin ferrochelatase